METRGFPLSSSDKQAILKSFFGCQLQSRDSNEEPYFCFYRSIVESSRGYSTIDTHRKISNLVELLKQPDATRTFIENTLQKVISDDELHESDDVLKDSINIAVRLLFMVSIGGFLTTGRPVTVSGETRLGWDNGTPRELMSTELAPQTTLKEHVKLDKLFNARNIERIAGIQIRWTSNLADHLRMRDEDRAVELFHYASFLKFHQNSEILSSALIDETLKTLALLLPAHDKDVENWFQQQQKNTSKLGKLPLDPLAREWGQLKVEERQIDNFQYWHDRLVILKQVFDEAEPSNIKQWWRDRRKRVQWYTFWVAAVVLGLTIFFGLVQSVEGAIQVYFAARQFN